MEVFKPNSADTLPSVVLGLPRGNIRTAGSGILTMDRPRFSKVSNVGVSSSNVPFHDLMRNIAHKQVRDAVKQKENVKEYLVGGWRHFYPKELQIPVGSFQTPTNLNGNTGYGLVNVPSFKTSGGARTPLAQKKVQSNLRKKAEFLKQQEEAIQQGTPDFIPAPPSVPLQEETAEKIAVQLTIQDAISSFLSSGYDAESSVEFAEPLRKTYQSLLKIGDQFSKEELNDYIESLSEVVDNMRKLIAEMKEGRRSPTETPSATEYQNIVRILSVFKAWFSTANIENPKERKRAVATLTKDFSKPLLLSTGVRPGRESLLAREERLAGTEAGVEEEELRPMRPRGRPRGRPRLTEEEKEARRLARESQSPERRPRGKPAQSRLPTFFPEEPRTSQPGIEELIQEIRGREEREQRRLAREERERFEEE